MIEITIAQAIVVALALIVTTIIIAQPFRKKEVRNVINLNTQSHRKIIEEIFGELQDIITSRFAPVIADYTRLKEAEETAKPKLQKSRAGETRKPSTLPKNATTDEKRKLKNRLRLRTLRAKKRAELAK